MKKNKNKILFIGVAGLQCNEKKTKSKSFGC